MSVRSIALIVAALVLIGGTIFVANSWLNSQRTPVVQAPVVQEEPKTEVLVARADLPTGIFVNEQHLKWQSWPDGDVPESYYIKGQDDSEALHGSVVRHAVAQGQPVTRTQIIHPGERGFLAAVLKPGYRAMSIKISATSGIAGLIFPGDRVDIILTHKVSTSGGKNKAQHRASETVLENVRVLALDQTLNDQTGQAKVAKTVTLQVTPKQAEMLAVVGTLGGLTLSLRSLAKDEEELERLANSDEPLEEPEPKRGRTYTWDAEASILVPFPNTNKDVVSVVRGGKVQSLNLGQSAQAEDDGEESDGNQTFEITVKQNGGSNDQ